MKQTIPYLFLLLLTLLLLPSSLSAQQNNHVYLPLLVKVRQPAGLWLSRSEIMALPTSGPAWEQVKEEAGRTAVKPDLSNQDEDTNVIILAKALVHARTGNTTYRDQVVEAIRVITYENTEDNLGSDGLPQGRPLSVGRKLVTYIIAADIINLPSYRPDLDTDFRAKLRELLTKVVDADQDPDDTIQRTHERRPNNWGTHAGATRIAIALYLNDTAELDRATQVFHGWLGDRIAYADFRFSQSDTSWQCDPDNPVAINPVGCAKEGHAIGGALPEEMRRGGPFTWPPTDTNYPWEALQGAMVQAQLLHRAGYPAWEWEDRALLRAAQFLYQIGWPAAADDEWQLWLLNHAYSTNFATELPANTGKNMGFTDWTHGG
ncbi:MAG: alginate lyase family protein [Anaerolineales bacterium]|nr:alginate lyase family protein [Anaerolineales bacterium]